MFSVASIPYFILYIGISLCCVTLTLWLWKGEISVKESLIQLALGIVVALLATAAGKYYMLSDIEILNGQVTSKHRDHDHWVESYQCMCTTNSKGVQSCSTCYRDHYTVDWYFNTTIGKIGVKSLDSEFRSVYNTPDPKLYSSARKGTPVSRESVYTNYVKNASYSLFQGAADSDVTTCTIPNYPRVHSIYKVNRVIVAGAGITGAARKQLSSAFNTHLKQLGPHKKVNSFVLFTSCKDQTYKSYLDIAWQGGKKNDVVFIIGTDGSTNDEGYPAISWADVMTFAGNRGNMMLAEKAKRTISEYEYFEIETLDDVMNDISRDFKLPNMEDYEYLQNEIDPPVWLVIVLSFVQLLLGMGAGLFFSQNDTFH